MDRIRRAINQILEQDPDYNFQNNPFIKPLIAQPQITIKYYKLEILIGIIYNIMFALFFIVKICPKFSGYFFMNKLITTIYTGLFFFNFIGQFTKLYILVQFHKFDLNSGSQQLKQKLLMLFSKRIYGINLTISSMYLICKSLGLSFTILKIQVGTECINKYLFIWCLIFICRCIISHYRYSIYFGAVISWQGDQRVHDLSVFKFEEKMKLAHPRQKNDLECLICRVEFNVHEELVEFPCSGKHCFHNRCIRNWLIRKASCPTCNQLLYDCSIFTTDF